MSTQSRPSSLIITLFWRMSLLVTAVAFVAGLMIFLTERHEIDKFYDGQLITGANVLRALMSDELRESHDFDARDHSLAIDDDPLLSPEDRAAFNAYADWRMFRIWRHGHVVLGSDTGPTVTDIHPREGFHTIDYAGTRWRIYALPLRTDDIVIQVGERVRIRRVLLEKVALELTLPFLFLIPASAALIWLSLADGLKVIRALMDEISGRSARDLSPIPAQAWPVDLELLIRSINTLFDRLDHAFQQERRFTDHAAHQLRTPLAALKLQVQMLAREEKPAERRMLLGWLQECVDRAAGLVEQLLTLARIEGTPFTATTVDLRAVTVRVLADSAPAAAERGIRFAFTGESANVHGDAALLNLVIANLVDNAIHHAPPASEIEIEIAETDRMIHLVIADHGPGIPAPERLRVFERFYRGPDESGDGTGLGLAIATEAAGRLGGTVSLGERADGGRGLRARVTFPRAPQGS